VDKTIHMRCNVGITKMNLIGWFGDFPEPVWCNPDSVATILSLYIVSHQKWQCNVCYKGWWDSAEVWTSWKGSICIVPGCSSKFLLRIISKNTQKGNNMMLRWPGRCKLLSCFSRCMSTPKLQIWS
jgi:hypothetical protein